MSFSIDSCKCCYKKDERMSTALIPLVGIFPIHKQTAGYARQNNNTGMQDDIAILMIRDLNLLLNL